MISEEDTQMVNRLKILIAIYHENENLDGNKIYYYTSGNRLNQEN